MLPFIPLDHDGVVQKLYRLGHFNPQFDGRSDWDEVAAIDSNATEFEEAVRSYQSYNSLQADGDLGPLTLQTLTTNESPDGSFRACGCPDIEWASDGTEEMNISNGTRTWPDPEKPIIFAYNFKSLPGLSSSQTRQAFDSALKDWNANCGLNLQLGAWDKAHVRIRLKGLGGGTLAIALLSLGSRKVGEHYQNYDSSNRKWYYDLAQEVVCHETGHTLGFSHSKDSGAIMYPTASGRKITLKNDDIRRAQKHYGPPLQTDSPPPQDPEDPGSLEGFIKLTAGGKTYFFNMSGETAE